MVKNSLQFKSLSAVSNSTKEVVRVNPYDEPTYQTELWSITRTGRGNHDDSCQSLPWHPLPCQPLPPVSVWRTLHFCLELLDEARNCSWYVRWWTCQPWHPTSDSLKRCLPALKSGFRVSVAQDVMEEWTLHWWYELTHGFNLLIGWAACFYVLLLFGFDESQYLYLKMA